MLDIVRAQALALTTEAWNVASIAKQRRSRRSTCTQEKEATLLRAAAEKAIGKRLSKRHRHEDREIGYGRQLSGNLKSGKMIIADDLDNRTQSPWRVRGVARSLGVTAYAWRQLHTWALLQLCEISGAEHQILSAFRRAYASVRPPSAYAAWVMVESVARLRCSIHRWDRADGPALSLILLKSAGDAMMKKTDVYDPKRPAAQKTREARAAVHGTPGSATALLPHRLEIIRGSEEDALGAASLIRPHAQHLLASAIMESCTPSTMDGVASLFKNCTEASSQLMEDAHSCAKQLHELYAGGGNYDSEGKYICTIDMHLPYAERLLATVSSAAESLLRSRAEMKAAVALLRDWAWLEDAAQTLKDFDSDQLDRAEVMVTLRDIERTSNGERNASTWLQLCTASKRRGRRALELGGWSMVQEAQRRRKRVRTIPLNDVVAFSLAPSLISEGVSLPEEVSLPLLQSGALAGESVWFQDREFVVADKPIAVCRAACRQRGLRPLSSCPFTQAYRAEMRYVGQRCDCSSSGGCACDVVTLYDRKRHRSVNWRTSHLPKIVDCVWRPRTEIPAQDPLSYDSSFGKDLQRLNTIGRELRDGVDAASLRRSCEQLTSPPDRALRRHERVLWSNAIRSLENEIFNNSLSVLRRSCNMNPSVVRDYWRA